MSEPTRSPPWRLFLALWPDEPVRQAIGACQLAWHWPPGAKLVPREQLHLTLHFIGNVAARRLPELAGALAVPFEPVELCFDRAKVWPGGIAVLQQSGPAPDPLVQLHRRLAQKLGALDLPVEVRPFRAHVTLARKAAGATPAADASLRWRADSGYVLVRSLPNGGGYEVVKRFSPP